MATQVQLRRGTATENNSFTGAQGELTFDTTNKRVRIHDGATAGGFELKTENSSGDTLFADNEKAIFGAGSDLQIYHDGSRSIIQDNGTGNLRIQANNLELNNADNSENYLFAANNGAVTLYYDNAERLNTTSSGINVSGNILRMDGTAPMMYFMETGVTDSNHRIRQNTGNLYFQKLSDDTNTATTRMAIDGGNGSISFYEDTGSTPKFFWDASAESLGIGTSSPMVALNVHDSTNARIALTNSSTGQTFPDGFELLATGLDAYVQNRSNGNMIFTTNNSEAMRIDSSGNVGIGTSSPDQILHLTKGSGATLRFESTTTGAVTGDIFGAIEFETQDSNSAGVKGKIDAYSEGAVANTALRFHTRGTLAERMRIDSSGNVGIGTSSPSEKLEVSGTGHTRIQVTAGTSSDAAIYLGDSGDADAGAVIYDNAPNALKFRANGSEAMRIDSSGRVMIAETSNSGYSGNADDLIVGDNGSATERGISLGSTSASSIRFNDGSDAGVIEYSHSDNSMRLYTAASEAMRIDSSGNLLVGKTSFSTGTEGLSLAENGRIFATSTDDVSVGLNRLSSSGEILRFQKDGSDCGGVAVTIGPIIGKGACGIGFNTSTSNAIIPQRFDTQAGNDNAIDLGNGSYRFDDIYATNGTIQTSDRNEKQDIAELSDAEQRVAVAAKGLLRKFRWRDAVTEKGDEARTHFGIIAQDLQAAFAAEGLDAGDYAMFISSTWTDEETGEERTRMGVRYSELLAFIIAAI